jgi:hypothetical protein
MTPRPKRETVVLILGFLGSENGGKMLHQNEGSLHSSVDLWNYRQEILSIFSNCVLINMA